MKIGICIEIEIMGALWRLAGTHRNCQMMYKNKIDLRP
jgi:hypothetical protein